MSLVNVNLAEKFPQYHKDVSHLKSVDVYRIIRLWEIWDPELQHALKKILAAGQRGAKSTAQDVQEAIDSLVRWQQIQDEDSLAKAQTLSEAVKNPIGGEIPLTAQQPKPRTGVMRSTKAVKQTDKVKPVRTKRTTR